MNEKLKRILFFLFLALVIIFISVAITSYINEKKIGVFKESINNIQVLSDKVNQLNTSNEELKKKVNDLESELVKLKKAYEESSTQEGTVDTIRPNISATSGPDRKLSTWKFEFDEEIDSTTLNIGNINLLSVSDNKKTLNNKPIKSIKYNKSEYILTIFVDTNLLECQGCKWELQFTNKIKDLAGNSLIPKSFSF